MKFQLNPISSKPTIEDIIRSKEEIPPFVRYFYTCLTNGRKLEGEEISERKKRHISSLA